MRISKEVAPTDKSIAGIHTICGMPFLKNPRGIVVRAIFVPHL